MALLASPGPGKKITAWNKEEIGSSSMLSKHFERYNLSKIKEAQSYFFQLFFFQTFGDFDITRKLIYFS